MVMLAEKYRGSREFGKNRRIAHSSWPAASYNDQHATITTPTFTTKARRHEDFSTNERGNYSDNLFVERRADADWSTPPAGTNPVVNNLYQGMALDPVTGLYNERARWYSPSLGTWISQDPLQYINGANTYQFVGSGPVGAVDPLGLCVPCYKCQQILDQEEAQSIQQIKQEAIGLGLPGSLSAFKIVGSSIVLAGADSIWGGLFTESIGALLGGAEALGKIAELNGLMDLQDAEIKSDIAAYNHCMANCSN